MPATPYVWVPWNQFEVVSNEKMAQLANNVDWLYTNTPQALWTIGVSRTEGIRICSGKVTIAQNKKSDRATVNVRFPGGVFSPGCEPVVTTSLVVAGQKKIFQTVGGIGKTFPDETGFSVSVEVSSATKKTDKLLDTLYVYWTAVGY